MSHPGTTAVVVDRTAGRSRMPSAPRPSAEGVPLRIEIATSLADIAALGPAWRALDAHAASPSFFQSYAWCAHVVRVLSRSTKSQTLEPFVMNAWVGDRLVAVWPLQICRESGARVLTELTRPFSQYADVTLATDSGLPADVVCRQLLDEARLRSRADALVMRKVRADAPLGQVLAAVGRVLDVTQRAPCVDMTGHATFQAFHATTKPKTRKNIRNATHRLEKLGTISHKVERRSVRMDEALSRCFDLRSTWLESKGLTSTAFAHPAFSELVRALGDTDEHDVDVLSMMLMLDDQPISIHYGFLHNRRYYAFMAARNPEFDACSPGKVHLEHVLSACHALGVEIVDLLAPEMPYKLVWATGTTEIADHGVTWTLRGWLAIELWRRARPLSRSAFLALPEWVRKRLAARLRPAET